MDTIYLIFTYRYEGDPHPMHIAHAYTKKETAEKIANGMTKAFAEEDLNWIAKAEEFKLHVW